MLATFVFLALVIRLVFWLYTGRIWEDALITITAARNLWDGVGLTHHASEPRVHSFTSPISVLIPLIGEGFHASLLLLRLSSLAAAGATIWFAYFIGERLRFRWAAHVLALSYLAFDQLQIFFGMAGMETQVVTAIALGLIYFYLDRNWRALGICAGLSAIARPEFVMFLLPALGGALLLFQRNAIIKVAATASCIAGPWYLFATLYYGSPVPNTIVAKSLSFRNGFLSAPREFVLHYVTDSWREYVPFHEFWIARWTAAPAPDAALKSLLALVTVLFVIGMGRVVWQRSGVTIAVAAVLGFLFYRNTVVLNSYYMWYLVPFAALAVLVVGAGVTTVEQWSPPAATLIALVVAFAYAMHVPCSMPLDRKVQQTIETAVREKTGRLLATMMGPGDTVVLEPLGFMGWAARNRTIFDFPGLGSKVSVRAIKQIAEPSVAALVDALQPTYAVLRPNEFQDLAQFPATLARYEEAAHIAADPRLRLRKRGYEYAVTDNDFRILRRTRDFEQVVRP